MTIPHLPPPTRPFMVALSLWMTLLTPSFCASLLLFTPFFSFPSSSSPLSLSLLLDLIFLFVYPFHPSTSPSVQFLPRSPAFPLAHSSRPPADRELDLTPSPLHSNAENRSLLLTTCPLVLIDPEKIAGSLSLLILLRSMTILGARSTPCSTLNCAGSDEN